MDYKILVQALVNNAGSQGNLAKKIGVSQSTISSWLGGVEIASGNIEAVMAEARSAGIDPEIEEDPKIVQLLAKKIKPGFAAPDKAMGDAIITKEQCRGARGMLGWNQVDLASESGVGIATIRKFEAGVRALNESDLRNIRRALEKAGVVLTARGVELSAG